MIAYLVIREGSKWTDVYRLTAGQVVTVGRAPTNQIVVKDERCSRNHCEVFLSDDRWILRDLNSRNGTTIGDRRIEGDYPLNSGEIFRIGQWQLAFVHDLAKAFPDSSGIIKAARAAHDTIVDHEHVLDGDEPEPAMITHRRDRTKFLVDELSQDDVIAAPKVGQSATKLCRLAFELAKATDIKAMATVAISGLFEEIPIDAGAILLLPRDFRGEPSSADLQVISSQTNSVFSYYGVSNFLASTVLCEGEAVLARNVTDDSTIGTRDSKGQIVATSILCAPIRHGKHVSGLIHLYSTDAEREPDPDDLEFTLAVADTVAVALDNPQPASGACRRSRSDPARERPVARATGRAERNYWLQHGDATRGRGNCPRGP